MFSGLNKSLITIEKPKDESFGELSTNVSMVLAKDAGIRPRDLAVKIVDILKEDEMISSADIAGPGFINFRLYKKIWIKLVKKILEDGEKFGLNISYSEDGKKLLGTGGAVAKAASAIDCENFFVIYGDSFLPIDYQKMFTYFQSTPKICNLMAVFRNCGRFDACNVALGKNKTMLYDKKSPSREMDHIDYGLSIINKKTFLRLGAR